MSVKALINDDRWSIVGPLLSARRQDERQRIDQRATQRAAFAAVVYVLTADIPWNAIPDELGVSGDTARHRFLSWTDADVWRQLAEVTQGTPHARLRRHVADAAINRADTHAHGQPDTRLTTSPSERTTLVADSTNDAGTGRGLTAKLTLTNQHGQIVHVMQLDPDTPFLKEYTQTPDWDVPFPVRDFGTGDDYESIIDRTPRGFYCDPMMFIDRYCRIRLSSLDGQSQFEFGNEVLGTAHLIFTSDGLLKFAPLVARAARLTTEHGYLPPLPDIPPSATPTEPPSEPGTNGKPTG